MWVIRMYNEINDKLVRELVLTEIGPKDLDAAGSLYLGQTGPEGRLHTYLDWEEDPEPQLVVLGIPEDTDECLQAAA